MVIKYCSRDVHKGALFTPVFTVTAISGALGNDKVDIMKTRGFQ